MSFSIVGGLMLESLFKRYYYLKGLGVLLGGFFGGGFDIYIEINLIIKTVCVYVVV